MDLKDKSFTVCKEKKVGGRLLQGEGTYVEGVSPEGPGLLGDNGMLSVAGIELVMKPK